MEVEQLEQDHSNPLLLLFPALALQLLSAITFATTLFSLAVSMQEEDQSSGSISWVGRGQAWGAGHLPQFATSSSPWREVPSSLGLTLVSSHSISQLSVCPPQFFYPKFCLNPRQDRNTCIGHRNWLLYILLLHIPTNWNLVISHLNSINGLFIEL